MLALVLVVLEILVFAAQLLAVVVVLRIVITLLLHRVILTRLWWALEWRVLLLVVVQLREHLVLTPVLHQPRADNDPVQVLEVRELLLVV